uniref:Uncharacterized protein n=1 Tax=uncultured Chlamydiae bacterium Rifle_16ft_4_minimus_1822 TaxID=1665093 RepID=A0A0H4T1E5_9BACT|nr:hypothetical protein [uncultured Chlamydiae bacterium Rifle_16ft_4_minimus_1822]
MMVIFDCRKFYPFATLLALVLVWQRNADKWWALRARFLAASDLRS